MKNVKLIFTSLVLIIVLIQCETAAQDTHIDENSLAGIDSVPTDPITEYEVIDTFFDRSTIKIALEKKIANKEPLIVHAYIPLCDNEHQGIVPTTASLGDGMSLKSNLYWATSGGTKAYFKKQAEWKLVYDAFDIDTNVLERVVFERNYKNTKVYLVADAYRGDRMEETINDYLSAISCSHFQTITLQDNSTIDAAGNSDLIMFNGHNGVMDNIRIKKWHNKTTKRTDVVMNACVSYGYLQYDFMNAGGYPLVRSKSLLYPGAYVLEQIIDDWVAGVDEKQLCLNAGSAYCKKHSCGAGTKVYKTGW